MSYQNISYDLPAGDFEAVKAAIDTIQQKLPFLVTLDGEERKALFKLGPKSADFVQDANAAANAFPTVLPQSFNAPEFTRDTTLFKTLSDIKLLLDSLCEKVDHTHLAVGSEAMTSSLEVYAYVQTAADRTSGLKSVAEKLKDRFKNQGPRKKESKPQ